MLQLFDVFEDSNCTKTIPFWYKQFADALESHRNILLWIIPIARQILSKDNCTEQHNLMCFCVFSGDNTILCYNCSPENI